VAKEITDAGTRVTVRAADVKALPDGIMFIKVVRTLDGADRATLVAVTLDA
jgi:hypothetical protein